MPPDDLLPVWHRLDGGPEHVAFWFRRPLAPGDIVTAATVVYADGRQCQDDDGSGTTGTIIVCGACGAGAPSPFLHDMDGWSFREVRA